MVPSSPAPDWPAEEEVTHVRKSDRPPAPPEALYKTAAPAARASIKAAVVEAYQGQVAALVRSMCRPEHRRDAEQAGAIGVLIGLEKYDPTRGVPFWRFARQWAVDEISKWLNVGVYWRVRSHKRADHAERQNASRPATSHHGALEHGETLSAIVDIEASMVTAEGLSRLRAFLATLPAGDVHLLLCDKRKTTAGGNNTRGNRYRALVARARAAVLGTDDEG